MVEGDTAGDSQKMGLSIQLYTTGREMKVVIKGRRKPNRIQGRLHVPAW